MKPNTCYGKMAKQCTNELVTDCDVYTSRNKYVEGRRETG